jgi:hypothetical protein
MEVSLWKNNFGDFRGFEYFITFVILVNSVVLGLYDYRDRDSITERNLVIEDINKVFTSIYTAEAVLKIIAQGFIMSRHAYLRDGWNFIDFFVVLSG